MKRKILKKGEKVVVAISGGLDSSTVAKILKEEGYEVIGVFMCFGIADKYCDQERARKVCSKLGIRFYPIDLSSEFKKRVKDYFLSSYAKGLTPNPCVACNKFLKFGELLKVARRLEAKYLATGHYLKAKRDNSGRVRIFRAIDRKKDQTYFLYTLTQEQLKFVLFPLGGKKKEAIRQQAEKYKLPYVKKESQDVCFLPADHNIYLKEKLKLIPGKIKTLNGKTIGHHQGLPLYTVGQRKGIEIGGIGPFYAVRMDHKTNTLYVVDKHDDKALYNKSLIAKEVNWISGKEPKMPFKCKAVIRYGHNEVPCQIAKNGSNYLVEFEESQRAVTLGQNIVFYKKDEMLGGGIINDNN